MDIQGEINVIKQYFKDKIWDGKYTIIGLGTHYVPIEVEGLRFNIWLSNGWDSVAVYQESLRDEHFSLNFSNEQQKKLYDELIEPIKELKKLDLQKQLDNL